ncbi:MAG: hypothetical protein NWR87_03750, partial [Rhodospirillales bacterium]|nr:hypothetical protein [Rhodospirillales bacterium]
MCIKFTHLNFAIRCRVRKVLSGGRHALFDVNARENGPERLNRRVTVLGGMNGGRSRIRTCDPLIKS